MFGKHNNTRAQTQQGYLTGKAKHNNYCLPNTTPREANTTMVNVAKWGECPKCGSQVTVRTSRGGGDEGPRYRYYTCKTACGHTLSTVERVLEEQEKRAVAGIPYKMTDEEKALARAQGALAHPPPPQEINERGFCPKCGEELPREYGVPCTNCGA